MVKFSFSFSFFRFENIFFKSIMSSVNNNRSIFYFLICRPFKNFLCLIALIKTLSKILNKIREGISCIVPSIRKKILFHYYFYMNHRLIINGFVKVLLLIFQGYLLSISTQFCSTNFFHLLIIIIVLLLVHEVIFS